MNVYFFARMHGAFVVDCVFEAATVIQLFNFKLVRTRYKFPTKKVGQDGDATFYRELP